MKVGDLVRTKQAHSAYGYARPVCIVIGSQNRVDGVYLKVIDPEGKTKRWWPYELEMVNESR